MEKPDATALLLVEVTSEGPQCIPCDYAIATVRHAATGFEDRLDVQIVETNNRRGAQRYLELSRLLGRPGPVPGIYIRGKLVYDYNPGPDELVETFTRLLAEEA